MGMIINLADGAIFQAFSVMLEACFYFAYQQGEYDQDIAGAGKTAG